eukprot:9007284-Pyramimonas_sp.AAC.1
MGAEKRAAARLMRRGRAPARIAGASVCLPGCATSDVESFCFVIEGQRAPVARGCATAPSSLHWRTRAPRQE